MILLGVVVAIALGGFALVTAVAAYRVARRVDDRTAHWHRS